MSSYTLAFSQYVTSCPPLIALLHFFLKTVHNKQWASATYTAIGASATGQRKLDLAPRMHIIADLNKEKLSLNLSHPITIP